ncbi:S1 family peptidase [Methanimicrococcus sp. OttesenSCG-928-J09]|nr:S1 family peptidase [Methanimicrococcus sp. OttesenSCG-928-J09]
MWTQKMIYFVILSAIIILLAAPAAAMNDIRYSSYHNMTAEEIQRIVDETTSTQIDRFDFIRDHRDNALGIYGIIPEKAKGVEAYEFWMQMGNISKGLANDEIVQSYHYTNGGPVIGLGTQCVCYTSIMILDERADDFTEEDMLILKERVDYYASLEGLSDSPIVFFRSPLAESYLTEYQILDLWESGYEGIIIEDGFENLTRLKDDRDAALASSPKVLSSSSIIGFEDYISRALSNEMSFIDWLLSLFGLGGYVELPEEKSVDWTGFPRERVRPLIGGLMIATSTSSGTIGFSAKEANDSNSRGIVTVAHVFHFENVTSYQPRKGYSDDNTLGKFSKMNKDGDSVFIPLNSSDVKAVIYAGEGNGELLDVIGYEGALSSGMTVSKSGIASGYSEGGYFGVRYNQTFTVKNGTVTYTVNHVGVLKELSEETVSIPGDSGGPVFVKTRALIHGTEQDAAVLLGILEGGDGEGTVYYVPCTEIKDSLGVIPLTVNDR